MKLTRRQLRRLIAEAFKQKVPLFDPVTQGEIDALRQKGRQDADLSSLSQQNIAKLNALDQSGDDASVNQARNVYQALGSTEPDISVEQEVDFFAGHDAMLQDMSDYNIDQAIPDIFINGNRNPTLLKQLGFTAVKDYPQFQPGVKAYEDYFNVELKAKATMLGKPESDMMIINDHNNEEMFDKIYAFLQSNPNIMRVSRPKNMYAGQNIEIYMSKKLYPHGKKILLDYGGGFMQIIL